MKARTTLYDLLGLAPTASEPDIQAAYLRLTRHYQSGNHGLSPADADNKLKAIREAVWILADPGRRAAYDAGLARTQPPAPELAPVVQQLLKDPLPLQVEIKAPKRSPLRIMLGVIGTLMIIGMLIQIFFSVFAFRRVTSGDAATEAQQRVMAAERRQTYGDLSEQEIAEQEASARRQREEQRAEYARKEEERQRERALQEREHYADRVSSELQQAEEAARRKAEYEKRQQEEQARRAEEEEQRRLQERLARERARLQLNN